jgi:hypothetical protein
MPIVESKPVVVADAILRSCPFRDGLPEQVLPSTAGGIPLERDTVVRLTTPCGLRTVWGRYGDSIVMVWKAPERSDAESGVMGVAMQYQPDPERFGVAKAQQTMYELWSGTIPMGTFYPADQIVASEEDEAGVAWFATRGENAKYWGAEMHDREERVSFWWRSGLWIFGVDTRDSDALTEITRDLAAYLESDAVAGI